MALAQYLMENPLITIFLCLGIGCLVGKIKIGSFSLGATASTLIVAMGVCLWAGQYGSFVIDKNLRTVFFAMFSFALGFDVGPSFFKALCSSGIKIVFMAIVYAAVAGFLTWVAGKLLSYDSATIVGLFAGAFTQSAIIGDDPTESVLLAYSMTYFIGTIGSIVFARYILPMLLKVDLLKETKKKAEQMKGQAAPETNRVGIVQMRAYALGADCSFAGGMTEAVEEAIHGAAEVERIYRGGDAIELEKAVLCAGDVLVMVGDVSALNQLDEMGMAEVTDSRYFQIENADAQIVLTTEADDEIYRRLTQRGIYIKEVESRGKRVRNPKTIDLKKGDILHVYGPANAVTNAVKHLGYLKDNGITTDIPFFSIALMLGLVIGSISFMVMGRKISMGASFGSLIVGLISGWWYDRNPKFGHISESTRWFVKSIGLNLYIAALGLTSAVTIGQLLSVSNLVIMAIAAVLVIVARIPVTLFSKYVLKLDTVDLVGGLCGSGTNTPALNSVTEYTGSSLYALSFAPGYAVGNVILILVGLVLGYL